MRSSSTARGGNHQTQTVVAATTAANATVTPSTTTVSSGGGGGGGTVVPTLELLSKMYFAGRQSSNDFLAQHHKRALDTALEANRRVLRALLLRLRKALKRERKRRRQVAARRRQQIYLERKQQLLLQQEGEDGVTMTAMNGGGGGAADDLSSLEDEWSDSDDSSDSAQSAQDGRAGGGGGGQGGGGRADSTDTSVGNSAIMRYYKHIKNFTATTNNAEAATTGEGEGAPTSPSPQLQPQQGRKRSGSLFSKEELQQLVESGGRSTSPGGGNRRRSGGGSFSGRFSLHDIALMAQRKSEDLTAILDDIHMQTHHGRRSSKERKRLASGGSMLPPRRRPSDRGGSQSQSVAAGGSGDNGDQQQTSSEQMPVDDIIVNSSDNQEGLSKKRGSQQKAGSPSLTTSAMVGKALYTADGHVSSATDDERQEKKTADPNPVRDMLFGERRTGAGGTTARGPDVRSATDAQWAAAVQRSPLQRLRPHDIEAVRVAWLLTCVPMRHNDAWRAEMHARLEGVGLLKSVHAARRREGEGGDSGANSSAAVVSAIPSSSSPSASPTGTGQTKSYGANTNNSNSKTPSPSLTTRPTTTSSTTGTVSRFGEVQVPLRALLEVLHRRNYYQTLAPPNTTSTTAIIPSATTAAAGSLHGAEHLRLEERRQRCMETLRRRLMRDVRREQRAAELARREEERQRNEVFGIVTAPSLSSSARYGHGGGGGFRSGNSTKVGSPLRRDPPPTHGHGAEGLNPLNTHAHEERPVFTPQRVKRTGAGALTTTTASTTVTTQVPAGPLRIVSPTISSAFPPPPALGAVNAASAQSGGAFSQSGSTSTSRRASPRGGVFGAVTTSGVLTPREEREREEDDARTDSTVSSTTDSSDETASDDEYDHSGHGMSGNGIPDEEPPTLPRHLYERLPPLVTDLTLAEFAAVVGPFLIRSGTFDRTGMKRSLYAIMCQVSKKGRRRHQALLSRQHQQQQQKRSGGGRRRSSAGGGRRRASSAFSFPSYLKGDPSTAGDFGPSSANLHPIHSGTTTEDDGGSSGSGGSSSSSDHVDDMSSDSDPDTDMFYLDRRKLRQRKRRQKKSKKGPSPPQERRRRSSGNSNNGSTKQQQQSGRRRGSRGVVSDDERREKKRLRHQRKLSLELWHQQGGGIGFGTGTGPGSGPTSSRVGSSSGSGRHKRLHGNGIEPRRSMIDEDTDQFYGRRGSSAGNENNDHNDDDNDGPTTTPLPKILSPFHSRAGTPATRTHGPAVGSSRAASEVRTGVTRGTELAGFLVQLFECIDSSAPPHRRNRQRVSWDDFVTFLLAHVYGIRADSSALDGSGGALSGAGGGGASVARRRARAAAALANTKAVASAAAGRAARLQRLTDGQPSIIPRGKLRKVMGIDPLTGKLTAVTMPTDPEAVAARDAAADGADAGGGGSDAALLARSGSTQKTANSAAVATLLLTSAAVAAGGGAAGGDGGGRSHDAAIIPRGSYQLTYPHYSTHNVTKLFSFAEWRAVVAVDGRAASVFTFEDVDAWGQQQHTAAAAAASAANGGATTTAGSSSSATAAAANAAANAAAHKTAFVAKDDDVVGGARYLSFEGKILDVAYNHRDRMLVFSIAAKEQFHLFYVMGRTTVKFAHKLALPLLPLLYHQQMEDRRLLEAVRRNLALNAAAGSGAGGTTNGGGEAATDASQPTTSTHPNSNSIPHVDIQRISDENDDSDSGGDSDDDDHLGRRSKHKKGGQKGVARTLANTNAAVIGTVSSSHNASSVVSCGITTITAIAVWRDHTNTIVGFGRGTGGSTMIMLGGTRDGIFFGISLHDTDHIRRHGPKVLFQYPLHRGAITGILVLPHSGRVVTCSIDGTLYSHIPNGAGKQQKGSNTGTNNTTTATTGPAGGGGTGGHAALLSTLEAPWKRTLYEYTGGHERGITSLAYCGGGEDSMAGGRALIDHLSSTNNNNGGEAAGAANPMATMSSSSSGNDVFVSAGLEHKIYCWAESMPRPLMVLYDTMHPHTSAIVRVVSVAQTPLVYSIDASGLVKLFDVRTGRAVGTWRSGGTTISKGEGGNGGGGHGGEGNTGEGGGRSGDDDDDEGILTSGPSNNLPASSNAAVGGGRGRTNRVGGVALGPEPPVVFSACHTGPEHRTLLLGSGTIHKFHTEHRTDTAHKASADPVLAVGISRSSIITVTATTFRTWSARTGQVIATHGSDTYSVARAVSAAIDTSGGLVAVGKENGFVETFDVHDGQLLRRYHFHTSPVVTVALDNACGLIFSCAAASEVCIWTNLDARTHGAFVGATDPSVLAAKREKYAAEQTVRRMALSPTAARAARENVNADAVAREQRQMMMRRTVRLAHEAPWLGLQTHVGGTKYNKYTTDQQLYGQAGGSSGSGEWGVSPPSASLSPANEALHGSNHHLLPPTVDVGVDVCGAEMKERERLCRTARLGWWAYHRWRRLVRLRLRARHQEAEGRIQTRPVLAANTAGLTEGFGLAAMAVDTVLMRVALVAHHNYLLVFDYAWCGAERITRYGGRPPRRNANGTTATAATTHATTANSAGILPYRSSSTHRPSAVAAAGGVRLTPLPRTTGGSTSGGNGISANTANPLVKAPREGGGAGGLLLPSAADGPLSFQDLQRGEEDDAATAGVFSVNVMNASSSTANTVLRGGAVADGQPMSRCREIDYECPVPITVIRNAARPRPEDLDPTATHVLKMKPLALVAVCLAGNIVFVSDALGNVFAWLLRLYPQDRSPAALAAAAHAAAAALASHAPPTASSSAAITAISSSNTRGSRKGSTAPPPSQPPPKSLLASFPVHTLGQRSIPLFIGNWVAYQSRTAAADRRRRRALRRTKQLTRTAREVLNHLHEAAENNNANSNGEHDADWVQARLDDAVASVPVGWSSSSSDDESNSNNNDKNKKGPASKAGGLEWGGDGASSSAAAAVLEDARPHITTMTFDPSRCTLITGDDTGQVCLWEVETLFATLSDDPLARAFFIDRFGAHRPKPTGTPPRLAGTFRAADGALVSAGMIPPAAPWDFFGLVSVSTDSHVVLWNMGGDEVAALRQGPVVDRCWDITGNWLAERAGLVRYRWLKFIHGVKGMYVGAVASAKYAHRQRSILDRLDRAERQQQLLLFQRQQQAQQQQQLPSGGGLLLSATTGGAGTGGPKRPPSFAVSSSRGHAAAAHTPRTPRTPRTDDADATKSGGGSAPAPFLLDHTLSGATAANSAAVAGEVFLSFEIESTNMSLTGTMNGTATAMTTLPQQQPPLLPVVPRVRCSSGVFFVESPPFSLNNKRSGSITSTTTSTRSNSVSFTAAATAKKAAAQAQHQQRLAAVWGAMAGTDWAPVDANFVLCLRVGRRLPIEACLQERRRQQAQLQTQQQQVPLQGTSTGVPAIAASSPSIGAPPGATVNSAFQQQHQHHVMLDLPPNVRQHTARGRSVTAALLPVELEVVGTTATAAAVPPPLAAMAPTQNATGQAPPGRSGSLSLSLSPQLSGRRSVSPRTASPTAPVDEDGAVTATTATNDPLHRAAHKAQAVATVAASPHRLSSKRSHTNASFIFSSGNSAEDPSERDAGDRSPDKNSSARRRFAVQAGPKPRVAMPVDHVNVALINPSVTATAAASCQPLETLTSPGNASSMLMATSRGGTLNEAPSADLNLFVVREGSGLDALRPTTAGADATARPLTGAGTQQHSPTTSTRPLSPSSQQQQQLSPRGGGGGDVHGMGPRGDVSNALLAPIDRTVGAVLCLPTMLHPTLLLDARVRLHALPPQHHRGGGKKKKKNTNTTRPSSTTGSTSSSKGGGDDHFINNNHHHLNDDDDDDDDNGSGQQQQQSLAAISLAQMALKKGGGVSSGGGEGSSNNNSVMAQARAVLQPHKHYHIIHRSVAGGVGGRLIGPTTTATGAGAGSNINNNGGIPLTPHSSAFYASQTPPANNTYHRSPQHQHQQHSLLSPTPLQSSGFGGSGGGGGMLVGGLSPVGHGPLSPVSCGASSLSWSVADRQELVRRATQAGEDIINATSASTHPTTASVLDRLKHHPTTTASVASASAASSSLLPPANSDFPPPPVLDSRLLVRQRPKAPERPPDMAKALRIDRNTTPLQARANGITGCVSLGGVYGTHTVVLAANPMLGGGGTGGGSRSPAAAINDSRQVTARGGGLMSHSTSTCATPKRGK